jgi:hypothetical protein
MSVALAFLMVALSGGAMSQTPTDSIPVFLQRVAEYVALHRRLEGPLPPEVVTGDPVALLASRRALAEAIREARPHAQQGDIFSPAVAQYFRLAIADALREGHIDDMRAIAFAEIDEWDAPVVARVNADYPAGRPLSSMPNCLLAALPPLPHELQYRFAGTDLILWDVHAGVIVDFVPRALPETTVPRP